MMRLRPEIWCDEDRIDEEGRWPPGEYHRAIHRYHAEQLLEAYYDRESPADPKLRQIDKREFRNYYGLRASVAATCGILCASSRTAPPTNSIGRIQRNFAERSALFAEGFRVNFGPSPNSMRRRLSGRDTAWGRTLEVSRAAAKEADKEDGSLAFAFAVTAG
jgi:hypothetical protein